MIVSIILIGLLSVAVLALPLFLKHGLPQELIFYLVLNLQYSFTSELETSGKVTGINKIDPSSKGGINSEPRRYTSTLLSVKQCSLPIKCFSPF
jgi:hypothetical protein